MAMVIFLVILIQEKKMQTIQASEFKAKCLTLMDKIAVSGKTLVVTKKGKTYRGDEALFWEKCKLPIRTPPGFGNPWRLTCPSGSGGS